MAKKILIKWNRPNLYRCGDFRIIPGVNEVRLDIWDAVKSNPGVVKRVEDGLITFVGAPSPKPAENKASEPVADDEKPEACSLKEYNTKQAVEIVKETLDLDTLKTWEAEEDRKTVQTAIEKQIELVSLHKDGEEDEGDDSDE